MTRSKKSSRPQHFQLIISLLLNEDFREIDDFNLLKRMRELNFITQPLLENLLLNFKFYAREENKTKCHLVDFRGQLERGEINRRAHWQLYLNTSAGVSTTRLLTFLSKEIMGEEKYLSIQLKRVNDVGATLEYVTKPERLELKDSDW